MKLRQSLPDVALYVKWHIPPRRIRPKPSPAAEHVEDHALSPDQLQQVITWDGQRRALVWNVRTTAATGSGGIAIGGGHAAPAIARASRPA